MNETADTAGSGLERAIERASHSESSLLLLGELGVGKCRAARAIHERSERRASPFLHVNCGTLADHVAADRVFGCALAVDTRGPAPVGTLYLDQGEASCRRRSAPAAETAPKQPERWESPRGPSNIGRRSTD
jgi:DNA-binding NtrC family response regulator